MPSEKFLGVPKELFKNPAAMLLLGLTLSSGVIYGLGRINNEKEVPDVTEIKKDIGALKEDRAGLRSDIQNLKEQNNRIENKLDRLIERSAYLANRGR